MDNKCTCSAQTTLVLLLLVAALAAAAPAPQTDDTGDNRLASALSRLDDALESLSSYIHDTRDQINQPAPPQNNVEEGVDTEEEPIAESVEIEERNEDGPRPEFLPTKRTHRKDGSRPEISAGADLDVKELEEAQQGSRQSTSEEKEDAVLRAALRYLLKLQKQDRVKKDYDIPFPIFGYKRSSGRKADYDP